MAPPAVPAAPRRRYVPAVGPRLRRLLAVVFGLFALLAVNSAYLVAVRALEAATGGVYQNWFYLLMFLAHLLLGAAIVLPVLVFGFAHLRNARHRPNRRAVRVGYALFATAIVLLASGVVLTRIEGVLVVKDPAVRAAAYWLHVVSPLVAAWLFVLHRLAGKRIRWRVGLRWAAVAGVFAAAMLALHAQDPRRWNVVGPESGERYFFPSLARTATGGFIPARALQNDRYCAECHADVHQRWRHSVHRFSSFNNPPYLFSVTGTREMAMRRDGDVQASRWCAGCHDPVPFFSGRFDDPAFDMEGDPTAGAGITCSVCHGITHVNSVRGNADYTIDEPLHYPFAYSENETLAWVNRQLVKAKPELHRKTFLKPFHRTADFCGACHKVHLPPELNGYKWLRGQDHFSTYQLSGVSGHGVASFYYPEKAETSCNGCHMGLLASDDFGARDFDGRGGLEVHDHLFPAANTGVPHLVGMPEWVIEEHREFNEGVMRVDLFGVKEGGTIDGPLLAPLRPAVPALVPGKRYLLEAVVRAVNIGHPFTQGTADSNQVWLEVTATSGGRTIGKSGGTDERGRVDPWSHFLNVYLLDRHGRRIDRRNAEDIFVPLYDHQVPPGAADVVHYLLEVPPEVDAPIEVEVRLRYRKFDTRYLELVFDDPGYVNDLPVLELARDRLVFPLGGPDGVARAVVENPLSPVPEWERWNDYGIALLRKGGASKGELAQAEAAFREVERLGRPDGPLNLARVYLAQGTVRDRAIAALARAAAFDPPAPKWSIAWLTGLVNKQNGHLDEAIANFRSIVELDDAETRRRGFDFSGDWRLLVELGQTVYERAKEERGERRRARREELVREAAGWFERALALDPEDAAAHWNLYLAWRELGDPEKAKRHLASYETYRPDDNARDRAVAIARAADPAADHAANAIVLYDLRRPGAYGLDAPAAGGPPAPPALRADAESAAGAGLAPGVPAS